MMIITFQPVMQDALLQQPESVCNSTETHQSTCHLLTNLLTQLTVTVDDRHTVALLVISLDGQTKAIQC